MPFLYVRAENIDQNRLIELANHKVWQSLLHYEDSDSTPSGKLSAIKSTSFFLAKNGKYDALDELKSTIKAFSGMESSKPEEQAHCQFPARFLWLKEKLKTHPEFVTRKKACKSFDNWRLNGDTESLSIVFATGYLGNPASFYGHTLVKLNSSSSERKTDLEDVSVNYGAIIPDDEDPVSYIVKGLFGKYDSGFSHVNYYFHDHNYGENELRDLWEYELNLTKGEVDFVIAHMWELLGKKYTYYFVRENCAFRMAELFSILDDVDILPDTELWTFPQAILQKVAESKRNGEPLVRKVKLKASRQSKFFEKFVDLNANEKRIVGDIASSNGEIDKKVFGKLSQHEQLRIIETLLDYYRILEKDDKEALASHKRMIVERFSLPKGRANFKQINRQDTPHTGRRPSRVSVGVKRDTIAGDLIELGFRPAYYDTLDSGASHVAFSKLSMADLKLKIASEKIRLSQFDLFAINSINSKATGLPGDSGFAWNLSVGWEELRNDCDNCTSFRFQGDMGYSKMLGEKLVIATYLGGGAQQEKINYEPIFARSTVMLQANISENFRLKLAANKIFMESFDGDDTSLRFDLRYVLFRDMDLRASYEKFGSEEIGLELGYYW